MPGQATADGMAQTLQMFGEIEAIVTVVIGFIIAIVLIIYGFVLIARRKIGMGVLLIVIAFIIVLLVLVFYSWVMSDPNLAASIAVMGGGVYLVHRGLQKLKRNNLKK